MSQKTFSTIARTFRAWLIVALIVGAADASLFVAAEKLVARRISLTKKGASFDLNVPENFEISVAAEGLRRVRFMALSPDRRIFVTDMYNLADNKRGAIYILEDFDAADKKFRKVTPYLTNLRNPNNVAFDTDREGRDWLYLALTDRLVRYPYRRGESAPGAEPETLATFPDYGLSYKYGGWHLTRTVAVGPDHKIYVSVGSSCNACEEKEEVRATIIEMDADGKNLKYVARGLRNAVGLKWVENQLFATNMGADHLGGRRPSDTMYAVRSGANYGWPYCYQAGARIYADAKYNPSGVKMNCRAAVPAAAVGFAAHSSPLGLDYFDARHDVALKNSFLVALHGSTDKALKHGYVVARVRYENGRFSAPEDFISGFLVAGQVRGRPADVFAIDQNAFLVTDDHAGVIYYVYRKN